MGLRTNGAAPTGLGPQSARLESIGPPPEGPAPPQSARLARLESIGPPPEGPAPAPPQSARLARLESIGPPPEGPAPASPTEPLGPPPGLEPPLVYGTKEWPDGSTYTGQCLNGQMHWSGILTCPDGRTYTGEFRDDHRHGDGIEILSDGYIYIGKWKDGKLDGPVTVIANGKIFRGSFENGDQKSPMELVFQVPPAPLGPPPGLEQSLVYGTKEWPDGSTYTGQCLNGQMHGSGILTCPDGRTYTGEFRDDHRHGDGIEMLSDGRVFCGKWIDGKLDGPVTVIEKEKIFRVPFVNGDQKFPMELVCQEPPGFELPAV